MYRKYDIRSKFSQRMLSYHMYLNVFMYSAIILTIIHSYEFSYLNGTREKIVSHRNYFSFQPLSWSLPPFFRIPEDNSFCQRLLYICTIYRVSSVNFDYIRFLFEVKFSAFLLRTCYFTSISKFIYI